MDQVSLCPAPGDLTREKALLLAKLSEQAERYDDMVQYMKQIVHLGVKADELTVEERNLLSVGYKNMMSHRRTAWRTVHASWEKNTEDGNKKEQAELDANYRDTIGEEVFKLISEVCDDIVASYVDGANKPTDDTNKSEVFVFFKKMEGDYNRYGAEITEGCPDKRETFKARALAAYTAAQEESKGLPSTNPIRLGLALNFSVFHYEICDKKTDASNLAKEAFDTAIDHLDTLGDDEYKDSTLIMQLLKDNLTLWTTDADDMTEDLDIVDMEDNLTLWTTDADDMTEDLDIV